MHGPAWFPQPSPTSKDPAAVQAVAELHETLLSDVLCHAGRVAIRSPDQRLPVHRSTTAALRQPVSLPQMVDVQTAVQTLVDVHETLNELSASPEPGPSWAADHLRPFQRSTNVATPEPGDPTAIQKVVVGHDTVDKPPYPEPGVGAIDHSRPFQRCTSGWDDPDPTATQNVADVHDTPDSPPV
jgi:hypothetical protein